jgi:uncharacterized protein (DUF433 family)
LGERTRTTETKAEDPAVAVEQLRRQVAALQEYLVALTAILRRHLFPLPSAAGTETVATEAIAPGWDHLVVRKHPWRKQLYVKGRNMTVRQLLGTVKSNQLSEEDAAKDLDLPVEAIREALRYAEENSDLLDFEAAYERLLLAQKGYSCGARPLPG